MAVGAPFEDSSAAGIDGDQTDNSVESAGAVYLFVRDGQNAWSQQAYIKASTTDAGDHFGNSLALSGDGNTLAVGAEQEDSNATGIDGDQSDNSLEEAGAVYVFERDGQGTWSQQAYVKGPTNQFSSFRFGTSVALSESGDLLAVGLTGDVSGAPGVGADPFEMLLGNSGAVCLFERDARDVWSELVYIKASNPGSSDRFGWHVALSSDATTLVVSAPYEGSDATGISGDQLDNTAFDAGAVYVY
jgi:hypothetical protein